MRAATPKQNQENKTGAYRNSKSGVRGVYWYTRYGKWAGRVKHHGKIIHVGYFNAIGEAESAVIAMRNQLFTHNIEDRK